MIILNGTKEPMNAVEGDKILVQDSLYGELKMSVISSNEEGVYTREAWPILIKHDEYKILN